MGRRERDFTRKSEEFIVLWFRCKCQVGEITLTIKNTSEEAWGGGGSGQEYSFENTKLLENEERERDDIIARRNEAIDN